MSSGDNYVADGRAMIGWTEGMRRLEVSLPHQCQEWIIGDIDHVRVMIADLIALLPEFEHPEKYRHEHVCIQCGKTSLASKGVCFRGCGLAHNNGLCWTCSAAAWKAKE